MFNSNSGIPVGVTASGMHFNDYCSLWGHYFEEVEGKLSNKCHCGKYKENRFICK